MKRLAAIDIGSNAVRLAIGERKSNNSPVTLLQKLRVPLRFGTDAFELGLFSESTMEEALKVFSEMKKHIDRYKAETTLAMATSAFRDAKNSDALIQDIQSQTGISIRVIDGLSEAELVFRAVCEKIRLEQEKACLIDIGGGSTEIIYSENGVIQQMRSFDIGTVRLFRLASLQGTQNNQAVELINHFKGPIESFLNGLPIDSETLFIGTGGTLRRMGKLRKSILRKKDIDHLRWDEFRSIYRGLKLLTPLQIQQTYGLRHDRSEVIVPAMRLVKFIFKCLESRRIEVPNVGLINGIFLEM